MRLVFGCNETQLSCFYQQCSVTDPSPSSDVRKWESKVVLIFRFSRFAGIETAFRDLQKDWHNNGIAVLLADFLILRNPSIFSHIRNLVFCGSSSEFYKGVYKLVYGLRKASLYLLWDMDRSTMNAVANTWSIEDTVKNSWSLWNPRESRTWLFSFLFFCHWLINFILFLKSLNFYFKQFFGVWLLYNVALDSAGHQSESAVCFHVSPLFWISFPLRSPQSIE